MPNNSAIWLANYYAEKAKDEANGNSGKGWLLNTCLICYDSFYHKTCSGPGGCLPGGSQNSHGSRPIRATNDFIVPDHLKDAGRLKDLGDCKLWLPHPNNRYRQREALPDSVADEGGEAADGAAGGSGAWKAAVKAAHEYGERNAKGAAGGNGARSEYSY